MAGDLRDLMHGAAESKRQLFLSEDFVGGYGRTVVGRVKRRRAVSATAMGGGTVVAVGVVAIGAANAPWSPSVLGAAPATSPSVVCTTATPGGVAGPHANVPDGAIVALVDNPSGEIVVLGTDHGTGVAWSSDGALIPLNSIPGNDITLELVLPSGQSVAFRAAEGIGWVVPKREMNVTALTLDEYVGQPGSEVIVVAEDGTVLGRAIHTASESLGMIADGKFYPLASDNGVTSYVDSQGHDVTVTLLDNTPSVGTAETAATPSVTCVTATPVPNDSASSAPSPAPSVSPSVSPSASPFASASSPFQCGYEFEEPVHNAEGLSIENLAWLTAEDAEQAMLAMNGGWPTGFPHPEGPVLSASAEVVSVGGVELPGQGERDSSDPQGAPTSPRAVAGRYFYAGLTVVGVSDGRVTATIPVDSLTNSWLYNDSLPESSMFGISLLDDDEALVSCSGRSEWDSIYVVAGIGIEDVNGWVVDPVYAWKKIESQG